MRSFFSNIFCCSYFGAFGKPQVLYIYFVTGHYTEFSFQLEERFHPVASLGCFAQGPTEAVAQQPRPIPGLSRGLVGPQLRLEEEALSPQEHPGVHLQAKYFSHEGASFTSAGILVRNYRMYFTTNSKHTSSNQAFPNKISNKCVTFLTPWTCRKMCTQGAGWAPAWGRCQAA